ncbi:MAG: ABC transporter ATP-binding protein, partial [Clostridia bacterium]|nr:ABC transporter ATP-binding protein [Clostridia bacterium]
MRKLLRFAGQYKKYLILAPILIIGEVVMETFIPQLIARLVNLISMADTEPIQMGELLKLGGEMVLMALLSLAFGAGSARAASVGAMGFSRNLRHALFEKVQRFSFKNIDKFSTASLVTRLTTDVNQTQNMLMMLVRMAVRSPIMFIMAFFWAWRLNPSLITILLVAVPILFAGMAVIIRLSYPRFRVMMTKYDNLNASVQENLTGIRVVKAFVRESFEKSKFAKAADDLTNAQRRAEKIVILNSPLMQLLMYGCVVSVIWFGGRQIARGDMQIGDLTAFITYITQILMSLMMLSFIFVSYVMS